MAEFLNQFSLFPLVLTLGTYLFAMWLQKKTRSQLCNPLLVSTILVIGVLLLTGIAPADYKAGTQPISWLLTPATVCLALPLYKQLLILKKNLPAILAGIAAGTLTSLGFILILCHLFALDQTVAISILPKSVTNAMGTVLSRQNGGVEALTAVIIAVTGIFGALCGPALCKLLKITHPIAQGVSFGTSSHVIGTSRATQLDPLSGAVSSLSLAVSGILTAILFPLACQLL